MLAQRKEHAEEPETLRRHREMYEERLSYLRLTQGRSEKEVADRANNPRVFKRREPTEPDNHKHKNNPTPSTSEK